MGLGTLGASGCGKSRRAKFAWYSWQSSRSMGPDSCVIWMQICAGKQKGSLSEEVQRENNRVVGSSLTRHHLRGESNLWSLFCSSLFAARSCASTELEL